MRAILVREVLLFVGLPIGFALLSGAPLPPLFVAYRGWFGAMW